MAFSIDNYIIDKREAVDRILAKIFPSSRKKHSVLNESIRYSLLANGKRLRPVICLASCDTFGGNLKKCLSVACAIEMIHTYSLIHDDLPSMDDDTLRRGLPTNHTVYGESTAILAGDALLTDSFNLIVKEGRKSKLSPELICSIVELLSEAAGSNGMVKGQVIDLSLDEKDGITTSELKKLHSLKTGALISASAVAGAIVAGAKNKEIEHLKEFSDSIGLAFQIIDDLLDNDGEGKTGKSGGSDRKNNKSTYLTVLGMEKSLKLVDKLTKNSFDSLDKIKRDTTILKNLAGYLGKREK